MLATSMARSSGCGCRRCGLARLKRVVHSRLLRRRAILGRCALKAACMLDACMRVAPNSGFGILTVCSLRRRMLASRHSLWSASCRATGDPPSVDLPRKRCQRQWTLAGLMRCCSRWTAASASRCTPCRAAHLSLRQRLWSTV